MLDQLGKKLVRVELHSVWKCLNLAKLNKILIYLEEKKMTVLYDWFWVTESTLFCPIKGHEFSLKVGFQSQALGSLCKLLNFISVVSYVWKWGIGWQKRCLTLIDLYLIILFLKFEPRYIFGRVFSSVNLNLFAILIMHYVNTIKLTEY